MNMFMNFFLYFVSILQFLFPFAFKDTEVPVQTTEPVVEETVIPGEHVHTGGNGSCLQSAICEICGEAYGGEGQHTYTATVKAATCLQGGYTTYRCRFCLHTEVRDYTDAKGHTLKMKTTEATCAVAGYNVYTCVDCYYSRSEEIEPAKGHDYTSVTFSANCTEGYRTVHTCNTCGNISIEQSADAIGHDYGAVKTTPTCDLKGYTTYTCTRCQDSYIGDEVSALGHSFTNYIPDGNGSCTRHGTATAICDNGCGEDDTKEDTSALLAHNDDDKNTRCDECNEKLYVNFSCLQYPTEALARLGIDVSIQDFVGKADKSFGNGKDIWATNKGTNENGVTGKEYSSIVTSPYFAAKVTGKFEGAETATETSIPVYGAVVYVGETGRGAIHSFSEVYIKAGEYATFEIEISTLPGQTSITNAVILPESSGEKARVENGTVKAIISGFGVHTFVFNNEDQAYAYTITIREDIDEDAEIAALREQGYEVIVAGNKSGDDYGAYVNTLPFIDSVGAKKVVIYLRRGTVLAAPHIYEINTNYDEFEDPAKKEARNDETGISQSRYAYITAKGVDDYKILGYGAIDLGRLDRSERRGIIISWARNVEIRGIKLFNAPQWSVIVYNSDFVNIKDVDVIGYRQNSDAFDICNSRDVTVDGCFARSGDDGFVVKTLGGEETVVTNTVTVKNSYAWVSKARAFGIFGETFRNISNVYFEDNVVLFHDATWNYFRIPAIGIVIEDEGENSGSDAYRRRLTNIVFDGIEICRNDAAAMHCIVYDGVDYYTIDGVKFKNISYEKLNTIQDNGKDVIALNTINSHSAGAIIEQNCVVENIVCGGTRITRDNYSQYFNYNTLYYCGDVIR